ncbi:MAG: thiamine biosynthesis protein ApbE [Rhodospirillaceae bacterium]|nr:MAG: thiamine biosynthesis protein ApbE [Rhodospirillaceae bacterium]
MKRLRHLFILPTLVLGLASCGDPPPVDHISTLYVFGTKVEITVRGEDADLAKKATAQLDQDFKRMHKDWHAWKPGELTNLNRAFAAGESLAVTSFLKPLLIQAKTFENLSDGLFNPAIGALISAWGFHNDEKPKGGLPDFNLIRDLAARKASLNDITIDGDLVSSSNATVQLDFGGFAKGVALDRAEQTFKDLGIKSALINAGGDINTLNGPDADPWQVGIRDPKSWGVIATLDLADGEDVYTSGNYERFREIDGVRYAHILNPATGMPVDHIVSATVITHNGALADAAATALTVAGPKDWHRIAKKMGIKFVILVDDNGTVYLNPAMKARIVFNPEAKITIIESAPL